MKVARRWGPQPSENQVTPEPVYRHRRELMRLGAAWALGGFGVGVAAKTATASVATVSDEQYVAAYNNYYEFSPDKKAVSTLAQALSLRPWTISVEGEVERPYSVAIDELKRLFEHEERIYGLRCVEGWSMVVPWSGFALSALLVRLRRPLGLWCFAYAASHAVVYLEFDIGSDWPAFWQETQEKRHLLAGVVALLLLLPLALTSPKFMVRMLGRYWLRLHKLTYVVAVVALLHFWWAMKPGWLDPMPDTLALGFLLCYRLLRWVGVLPPRPGDDGQESPERGGLSAPAQSH